MEKLQKIYKIYCSKKTIAIVYILSVIAITTIYIPFVPKIETPLILPDEIGNISNALYFRGINWSSVVQYIGYYGFGSSVFYTPLSLFCKTSTALYKGIIIVNILLILLSHFILIKITKRFTENKVYPLNIFISAVAVSYASYIGYALGAMYETIILFAFILVVYCEIRIYESGRFKWVVLLGILLPYCLMIHLRLISILITGLVFFICVVHNKKISAKKVIVFIAFLMVGVLLMLAIKNILVTNVWLNSTASQGNSFGAISNIKFLFSVNGVKKFIVILAGQLFYMGSSTLMLGWIVIVHAVKTLIKLITRKEQVENKDLFSIFLAFNYLIQIFVVCIFFIDWKRMDQIFYGRYSEYNYAFLIATGFYILLTYKDKLKEILLHLFSYSLLGLGLYMYLKTVDFPASPTCAAVISFRRYLDYSSNNYSGTSLDLIKIVYITLVLSLVVLVLYTRKTGILKLISVLMFGSITVLNGVLYAAHYIVPTTRIHYANKAIAEFIEKKEVDSVNYLFEKKSINVSNISSAELLQFGLYDKKVDVIDFSEFDYSDEIVVTPQISVFNSELFNHGYYPVYIVRNMMVWEKLDSNKQNSFYEINGVGFYSNNTDVADYKTGSIISNGKMGYLTYGPYTDLSKGSYDFTLNLSLRDTQTDKLGFFEIYSSGKTYYNQALSCDDFDEDGNCTISMPVLISEDIPSVQFRTFLNDSVYLQFNSLTVSQHDDYEFSYTYNFAQTENLFISGFSKSENGVRWATTDSPEMIVFLPDKDTTATITFGYSIPFEQLGIDSYDVDILMNGNEVGQVTLLPGQDDTFVLPISDEVLEEGENKMSFVGEFEWSPSDYGSLDTRTLSFSLESIKFEPAA